MDELFILTELTENFSFPPVIRLCCNGHVIDVEKKLNELSNSKLTNKFSIKCSDSKCNQEIPLLALKEVQGGFGKKADEMLNCILQQIQVC
jgi:hypothetical protein